MKGWRDRLRGKTDCDSSENMQQYCAHYNKFNHFNPVNSLLCMLSYFGDVLWEHKRQGIFFFYYHRHTAYLYQCFPPPFLWPPSTLVHTSLVSQCNIWSSSIYYWPFCLCSVPYIFIMSSPQYPLYYIISASICHGYEYDLIYLLLLFFLKFALLLFPYVFNLDNVRGLAFATFCCICCITTL